MATDYDAYDAILHHIFRETQGDAWFKPLSENLAAGVCIRVAEPDVPADTGVVVAEGSLPASSRHSSSPALSGSTSPSPAAGPIVPAVKWRYRVFPYENPTLAPFEAAVRALNPVVAVKVRSAAVHAALGSVPPNATALPVDAETRIQILETMSRLPRADKEQSAAFIRDERVLIVWSDSPADIVPACAEFERKLTALVMRALAGGGGAPVAAGLNGGTGTGSITSTPSANTVAVLSDPVAHGEMGSGVGERTGPGTAQLSVSAGNAAAHTRTSASAPVKRKRTCWGFGHVQRPKSESVGDASKDVGEGVGGDTEKEELGRVGEVRKRQLLAPLYGGLACALSCLFMGEGIRLLLSEYRLDSDWTRFCLCVTVPFIFCISIFFTLQLVGNITFFIGPVSQYHENSIYYSAIKPRPNRAVDEQLPHVTIQMPVYKESLELTITPSVESLKKAMQTYARQGGTSTIFINDDGMQLLPPAERLARQAFYAQHGIGWVARPKHDPFPPPSKSSKQDPSAPASGPSGFVRPGRFKKASNMNYGLALSLKVEKFVLQLLEEKELEREAKAMANVAGGAGASANVGPGSYSARSGATALTNATNATGTTASDFDIEEQALQLALEETYEESGRRWMPWAANARALRVGEIILIVDSDTVVPEDCLRDAARELAESPEVAIIQHESDVMQVAHHWFENGIAHFTRRINKCITMACANGEVAPFVGHNAFLRWEALQDAAFIDPADEKQKIWSESNVSEDFDMALRLQLKGYSIRWASYSNGGFKEGVSLTCDDELNRWEKYAYGCNELLFNPLIEWWRKGPINAQLRQFVWSNAPLHYKISMLAYMFSYYGIAAGATLSLLNYIILGFTFSIDGFYLHSFEVWLACTVVFPGAGNIGFSVLEYRLGSRNLLDALVENLKWIPFFFFFFGGLSIHLSTALLAHLFSYNMTWQATKKEVERSNFFIEGPRILRRFWLSFAISFVVVVGMVVLSTNLVPPGWQIPGTNWAVIFPLAITAGCHILFPIVLNPWLMIFSY